MSETCIFCGAPADHWHHPTARLAADTPHLDPGFVVPVCRSCHYVEHAAWRDVGIDALGDPMLARLLRSTWLVGRIVDLNRAGALTEDILRGFHGCLIRIAEVRT
jgi:hypothetical protein